MTVHEQFDALLQGSEPMLVLAPMQDVTDRPFWDLMHRYGGPDVYFTEYFRVQPTGKPEKWILDALINNKTGKPAVAQMIGNDIPSLVRIAKQLEKYDVVAIDLNLGCPAPVVYRKCAGGGLLREPQRVDSILGALRDAVSVKFTVKTRIGFDSPAVFDELLPIFAKHSIDMLTVHGRTVKEMYRSEVHYEYIAQAVSAMRCPVIANGNVYSPAKAEDVLKHTGAKGLMIGRGAIRNPWLFEQFRQYRRGEPIFIPTGRDVLDYVRGLWAMTPEENIRENAQVQKMKKYMNFLGIGLEPSGKFLHDVRRATTKDEFFRICATYMDHDEPMPLEPFKLELAPTDVVGGEHL
jgi:tRNA-dihydrouridine synthase B